MNELLLNKTYRRQLPQDAFFPCRIKARPKQVTEGFITLDRFYSLMAKRLYVSVKGVGLDKNKSVFISLYDKFSGRQIIPKTDVRTFTPNFNQGLEMRLEDNDNIHHYFREQAPLSFMVESEQDVPAQVDFLVLGERFFTGLNQGSDFTGEIELIENPEQMPSVVDGRIEFKYLPKPLGMIFKATLHNGEFIFNKNLEPIVEATGELQIATGEYVGYKLNPMSQYKLSEISIHSNLPQEVFAGAVKTPFQFNLRSTRKQSMMAFPFVFNSHIIRSEVESYMQNINADATNFLIGNLYGSLEQTSQIVSLGINEVRVIVNCVVYEGKEKLLNE